MHIKNFLNKTVDFAIKRIVELLGVIFVGVAILLFLALISYSPEDPNFVLMVTDIVEVEAMTPHQKEPEMVAF